MKAIDYLYYKIYRVVLKGSLNDIAPFAAMIYSCGIICLNLFVIGAFMRKIGLLPFFVRNKNQMIIFMISFFVLGYFYFIYGQRYKRIIAKHENENANKRKRGNLVVWTYIILSFLMIFAVAFYKPGVL